MKDSFHNGVVYYKKEREGAKNILSVLRNFKTTEKTRSDLEKDGIYFSYPKPVDLIKYLISAGLRENDIVLDFFSGSGTTGHALYELMAETELNASFILVQMLENTNKESLAYQKGYKTIPQITKKRLTFFAKKLNNRVNDFGYRYFSLVNSNYKVWHNLSVNTSTGLENVLDIFSQEPLNK